MGPSSYSPLMWGGGSAGVEAPSDGGDRCGPDVDSWGWFRGSGGSVCIWLWGRGRGWCGGHGPPMCMYTHTHTLGWVWRTIPPFKMLPRQVLPASWEGKGNHLSILPQLPPPEQEDEAGVNSLMSFSPSSVSRPARPRGHLQGQAWTSCFVKLVQPCHFCISVAPCCAGVGVCELFSHVQLCDPMDCSPPEASVHGIFQGRILEWVAMPFSKVSSQLRD